MKCLDKVFDVWYGVNLEVVNSEVVNQGIPFVSRQSVNNGIVCHIKRIDNIEPNPANTLSIAVSGSVLSTFYHDYEYYSGRDVYVAKPKMNLTKAEMLYYCYIIEQNKYRYNYGRGANKTFRDILVPSYDEIPNYIKNQDVAWQQQFNLTPLSSKKLELNVAEWKWFRVGDLFEVVAGKYHYPAEYSEGETPYLSATAVNNGIGQYIDLDAEFEGNIITTEKVKCTSYYQPKPFCATSDVNIIKSRNNEFNKYIGLFLSSIIDFNENYRWCYGRQCRVGDTKDIVFKLPAIKTANGEYEPDWQWMEDYIKGLPYSGAI